MILSIDTQELIRKVNAGEKFVFPLESILIEIKKYRQEENEITAFIYGNQEESTNSNSESQINAA